MDLNEQTVETLREMARDLGIPSRGLKKTELVDAIRAQQEGEVDVDSTESYDSSADSDSDSDRDRTPIDDDTTKLDSNIMRNVAATFRAPKEAPKEAPSAPDGEYFLVTADAKFFADRCSHIIRKGTVVSQHTHSLADLRAQKVPMVPCTETHAPISYDAYGDPIYLPGRDLGDPPKAIEHARYRAEEKVVVLHDGSRVPIYDYPDFDMAGNRISDTGG